jgi:hypothetical protein
MPKGKPQVRLYGYAMDRDRPYVLWICVQCAQTNTDSKASDAVKDLPREVTEDEEAHTA